MADDAPSAIDPDGRLVLFDAGSHLHLAQGNRSWLLDHIETILTTIARPDYREDDPQAGRERFYRQNALTPGRALPADYQAIDAYMFPPRPIGAKLQRQPRAARAHTTGTPAAHGSPSTLFARGSARGENALLTRPAPFRHAGISTSCAWARSREASQGVRRV